MERPSFTAQITNAGLSLVAANNSAFLASEVKYKPPPKRSMPTHSSSSLSHSTFRELEPEVYQPFSSRSDGSRNPPLAISLACLSEVPCTKNRKLLEPATGGRKELNRDATKGFSMRCRL